MSIMGRPSIAEPRKEQILAAMEECVLREGLANTTIQAVAEEAGFHRTLINHYFGDMQGLVRGLTQSVVSRFEKEFVDTLGGGDHLTRTLDFLFQRKPSRENRLIGAFRSPAASPANDALARMYEGSAKALATLLRSEFPDAPPSDCSAVAFSLVCLSMSRYQLESLSVSKAATRSLRKSAETLVDSLRES